MRTSIQTFSISCFVAIAYHSLTVACPTSMNWSEVLVDPPSSTRFFIATLPSDQDQLAGSPGPLLQAYRNEVQAVHPYEPTADLLQQAQIFENAMGLDSARLNRTIAEQEIGVIRQMTCLESLAFELHFDLFPISQRAEFRLKVYAKGDERRALFASGGSQGSGPSLQPMRTRANQWKKDGWNLTCDLHNHPFQLEPQARDRSGTLVPSGWATRNGDLPSWGWLVENEGLLRARITNGFHTIVFSADEILEILRRRPLSRL